MKLYLDTKFYEVWQWLNNFLEGRTFTSIINFNILMSAKFTTHFLQNLSKMMFQYWKNLEKINNISEPTKNSAVFFPLQFSFTDTNDSQDSREKGGTIFFPLFTFHTLTNIQTFYFQLCIWDDYFVFLIKWNAITRIFFDEILSSRN